MHVLVIDDEPAIRQVLTSSIRRSGHSVDQAANVAEASAKLVRGDVDVALCDIHMPDGNGLDLVRSFKGSGIDTHFVMVTAFGSMETAVEALKAGATDYIIKPVNNEELQHRLGQLAALRGLRDENLALRKLVSGGASSRFRFVSPAMQDVERMISKVAKTESTVLITGESGTGKGVMARMLHEASHRASSVFLPVNCGAIPENLLESEFFGHVKGAFTGAERARKGLFLEADRGTLFLDEIGELPVHMQAKLLHAIEEKEIRPVGGEQSHKVDVRIVAATNRDLPKMAASGKFRDDLYFRLSMFHVNVPPLRERRSDLDGLIAHILSGLCKDSGREVMLDAETAEILKSFSWPGNVRQLENVLTRAYVLADGDRILPSDLPGELFTTKLVSVSGEDFPDMDGGTLRERMRRYEAFLIQQGLEQAGGDRRVVAQRLGIGLSSLYRKIEEYAPLGWVVV